MNPRDAAARQPTESFGCPGIPRRKAEDRIILQSQDIGYGLNNGVMRVQVELDWKDEVKSS